MFQKIFPQTLRNRILLTMTLTMLILVLLPAFLFYQNFMDTIATIEKDRGQTAYKQVLNTLKTRGKAMAMLSIAISNEPSVQELFHKKDRKALQKLMMPVFKKLNKVYKINVFHFHKQPAVSFLRMQKPEKFGDDLSGFRHTVIAANKTQKMIIALEKGVAGLSNRAVIPVFYKNMHIGSLEFGMPIDNAVLLSIKKQVKNDISIVVPDGDRFKYQAKTHNLTIPEKKYPFLRKMFTTDKLITKKVVKNNRTLITTYGPIKDFSGKTIAILAVPIDITQVLANARNSILKIISIGIAVLLCALACLVFFFQYMVNRPINFLREKLEKASSGDLSQKIQSDENQKKRQADKNEFILLNNHFNNLLTGIKKIIHEIDDNSNNLNNSAASLASVATELNQGADQTVNGSKNAVKATEKMSENMDSITTTIMQASENVQTMISGTEEISTTINNIRKSTVEANNVTGNAVKETEEISGRMDELNTAARDIDKVTDTISDISDQINMLALNATIEAARAGEAGKGFAVVANEIKALAQQTGSSIEEISTRIEGIQKYTNIGVTGIKKITNIIKNIDEIVSDIKNSLDEQGNSLTELTQNIQHTGTGITEVASSIEQSSKVSHEIAMDVNHVNTEALTLSKGSADVKKSAENLKHLSEVLRSIVQRFKLE